MEQVLRVAGEFLDIWNRYMVFQRSVYLYGTGIWCSSGVFIYMEQRGVFIYIEQVYSIP